MAEAGQHLRREKIKRGVEVLIGKKFTVLGLDVNDVKVAFHGENLGKQVLFFLNSEGCSIDGDTLISFSGEASKPGMRQG